MKKYNQKNSIVIIMLLIISFLIVACDDEQTELSKYLKKAEMEYEQISIQMGEAYWNLYSDESIADLETPKERYVKLFTNDTLNYLIDDWYQKRTTIKNDTLMRRVEVWHNILTAANVNYSDDNLEIQSKLEFWLAEDDTVVGRPSQEEMESMVVQLMKKRDKKAIELGYDNYGELILEVTETGYDWFANFAKTIDDRTYEPYKNLIDELKDSGEITEFNTPEMRSLMMQYYTNQITPRVAGDSIQVAMKMILESIGIDYDNLPIRFIENEMPPGIGGQGIAVQIPNDIRVALMPGMDFPTWMHELGHGLQAMNTEVDVPILKGYEWSLGSMCGGYAEGLAEVSAKFSVSKDWVNQLSPISEEQLIDMEINTNKYRPVFLRMWLNQFMFEFEYYKNTDQDPVELRRKLTQEYMMLDSPQERVRPIANMAVVSYPLYTQNYLIAEILSWQVHETLRDKFGESYATNSAVGDFLKEHFYKDGNLLPWQQYLNKATGRELDVDGYLTHYEL